MKFLLLSAAAAYLAAPAIVDARLTPLQAINTFQTAALAPYAANFVNNFQLAAPFVSQNVVFRGRGLSELTNFNDFVEYNMLIDPYNITGFSGPGTGIYYFANYTIRQYSQSCNTAIATVD